MENDYARSILGPGATNFGPGSYDWIIGAGDKRIAIHARNWNFETLVQLQGPKVEFAIETTYDGAGNLSATQISAKGMALAELISCCGS